MHSITLAHGLIVLMGIWASSVRSSPSHSAAFKVQSYASDKPTTAASSYNPSNQVTFTNCLAEDYVVYGVVNSMTITPCDRSSSDAPCTFVFRHNYTIELEYETSLDSPHPRSSVVAYDDEGQYQYSQQSFNGCNYTLCPIRAYKQSSYVYHFQTLASPFNALTFNVTRNFTGPSLFCASTKIDFERTL